MHRLLIYRVIVLCGGLALQNAIGIACFQKLRMEMGNMSKRRQPDQREDNYRRLPMGLQRSGKITHPEVVLSWPLNKIVN